MIFKKMKQRRQKTVERDVPRKEPHETEKKPKSQRRNFTRYSIKHYFDTFIVTVLLLSKNCTFRFKLLVNMNISVPKLHICY